MDKTLHLMVWKPFRHPVTGARVNMLCNYTDRIISEEQARGLNELYNLPAAPGSMRMSGGSNA